MANEMIDDKIHEGETDRAMTVAEYKRARKVERENLNMILLEHQKQVIAAQAIAEESRKVVRVVYNAVQACIRALFNKGLITNVSVEHAGKQLWKEAQENMEKAQAAKGTAPVMKKMPIDHVAELVDKSKPVEMGGAPPKEPQKN